MNLTPEPPREPCNVVPIDPSASDEVLLGFDPIPLGETTCFGLHKTVTVHEKSRTVTCEHCGRTVDPFDYLAAWAKEGHQRMAGLKTLALKTRIAQTELTRLEHRIKLAREKLKRAGQPQPQGERDAYNTAQWNPESSRAVIEHSNAGDAE